MTKKQLEATPLMQQYAVIKEQYPDTLIFFQVGDFYELFFDDAKTAAAFLGITLTARGKNKGEPIPLCGVPIHAIDHYMSKLVKGGFRVAICDQLEPPRPGTVVKRGVTQVLTPGTLTDTKLLDDKSASYLFSFFPGQDSWGLLFGELLTAQLFATTIPVQSDKILESELARFFPDEILVPRTGDAQRFQPLFKKMGYFTTQVDETTPQLADEVDDWMKCQFNEKTVSAFENNASLHNAMRYFYAYVQRNQRIALDQFSQVQLYQADDFLMLDAATQRNLELVRNTHDGSARNTLFSVMDGAQTAMGSRMIKKWIQRPLVKQEVIEQRLDAVDCFVGDVGMVQQVSQFLTRIGDIERVVGRIALNRAQLDDYLSLKNAFEALPYLLDIVSRKKKIMLFSIIKNHLNTFTQLKDFLVRALNEDRTKEWLIKPGFDETLDGLRELVENSNKKIIELEQHEQRQTGISSLKIRFNQVHGYYIEVTKANLHLVPDQYTRQQTLVGRERFITPALQQLQHEIMRARNEIDQVEKTLFESVKQEVASHISALRKCAHALAHLDALLGVSHVAYNNGFVRPTFNDVRDICITAGRHPVVEQTSSAAFIPNNTNLTNKESTWIITGPNMGGKSTYLRQVALMSVMAQCGSFVPAQAANLALTDRIFTRVGAGDNLAEGKSTFLVEMEETATICNQATERSLVILDEVGRGTSTFDGLAIAQAVVEHIHTQVKARCLFATHYHELTHLEEHHPGLVSYYAASRKTPAGIVFLYKMVCGVADGSFGVEVAKLADLPLSIVGRAQQLLDQLSAQEQLKIAPAKSLSGQGVDGSAYAHLMAENQKLHQMVTDLTGKADQLATVKNVLQDIDYDDLSPRKAFDVLWKLRERQV